MDIKVAFEGAVPQLEEMVKDALAAALRNVADSIRAGQPVPNKKKAPTKSTITPAGRKKLAAMMRARWAERKRAQRAKKGPSKSPTASAKV